MESVGLGELVGVGIGDSSQRPTRNCYSQESQELAAPWANRTGLIKILKADHRVFPRVNTQPWELNAGNLPFIQNKYQANMHGGHKQNSPPHKREGINQHINHVECTNQHNIRGEKPGWFV